MASLAERLVEAENAYHRLATGTSIVEVTDSNGERVKYGAATINALAVYLAVLRRQVAGGTSPKTIRFQTSKGI